jgi:predicted flap endonuclease-1-like 5' DNA nuclease
MLWFALQLLALLVGAALLGVLVGWIIWARSLRADRAAHVEEVEVLRKQLASLADEGRRTQQRFATVGSDLDTTKLQMQSRDAELSRAREAFAISQQNVASAESELAQAQRALAGLQGELMMLRESSRSSDELAIVQAKLDAQLEAQHGTTRNFEERLDVQQAALAESEKELLAAQQQVADSKHAYEVEVQRNQHLTAALNAAVDRANEAGRPPTLLRVVDSSGAGATSVRNAATHSDNLHTNGLGPNGEADVLALAASWRTQSEIRNREAQKSQAELQQAKRQLRIAESNLAMMRSQQSEHLVAVRRNAILQTTDAAQAESANAAARHESKLLEQSYAHKLAIEHWQRDLSLRNEEIDSLSQRSQQAHAELAVTQSEFERVAYERHMLDEAHQRALNEVAHLGEIAQHKESQIDQLRAELHDTKQLHAGAAQSLADQQIHWENASAEFGARAQHLEHQAAQFASQGAQDESKIVQLQTQVAQLEVQVSRADEELDSVRGQLVAATGRLATSLSSLTASEQLHRELAQEYDATLIAVGEERLRADAELQTRVQAATESGLSWKRELMSLRSVHDRTAARAGAQQFGASFAQQFAEQPAKRARQRVVASIAENTAELAAAEQPVPESVVTADESAKPTLQRIEGIGPKIEAALLAAGIGSFIRLSVSTPDQLRDALASAGLTFAPSLVTWAKQATFLVDGDEAGFSQFQNELIAARTLDGTIHA